MATSKTTTKTIAINHIRIDGNTQSRCTINQEVVAEYAALLSDHVILPSITLFFDGAEYWLADGFHRLHAHRANKKTHCIAEVHKGTQRDAVLYSLNANVPHGLNLSSEDKRKGVLTMLADPEWSELSDRAIARHCGCSHMTVGRLRNPEQAEAAPKSGTSATAKPTESGTSATEQATATGTSATPITLDSPQTSGTSAKTEPTAKTQAQLAAEQNAADAHGDSDPIAMLEEAQKQIEGLQKELFALSADDQRAETLKYKRIADVATRRQNELMDTVNAREKELQRMANWLRRIGTALGEDDNAKLPALVEAMARKVK